MTRIDTSEIALAAKLYAKGCHFAGFKKVKVRGRDVLEFGFDVEDTSMIDDYRTGADGITQYENCRRMLVRICDTEVPRRRG